MTPEEQAHTIAREWWDTRKISYNWTNADEQALAAVIRAAVEAERADLAQACEALTMRRAAEMGLASHEHLTGWQCAALIRARGKVELPE